MSVAILAPGSRARRFSTRLGQVLVTLFGLLLLTFFIGRVMPVDPVLAIVGPDADQSTYQQVYQQLGFDKSLLIQFGIYFNNLLHGDLGNALLTGKPVTDDILRVFPATLELATMAIIVGAGLGIPLGVLAAARRNSVSDYVVRIISLAGYSTPIFWVGMMGLLLFYAWLGWAGSAGRDGWIWASKGWFRAGPGCLPLMPCWQVTPRCSGTPLITWCCPRRCSAFTPWPTSAG